VRLPAALSRLLLVAATAAFVSFPILSLKVDESQIDADARELALYVFEPPPAEGPAGMRSWVTITADSLVLGGAILSLGVLGLLLGAGIRALKRREAWESLSDAAGRAKALLGTRRSKLGFGLALAAVLVLFPFVMERVYVSLGVETMIYVTLALGLNVIVGYAGLLVLGYAAFFAIGAYTYALLAVHLDLSMWLAFPFAGGAAFLAGLLLGLPSLRLRGDYLAIVTLGFGLLVWYFLKTEQALTGGEMGLPNKDVSIDLQAPTRLPGVGVLFEPHHFWWPSLLLASLAVVVIRRVERSRIGRALVAMREDETAARCMGIHTTRLKLSAFAFSAMWAGFAGVLWCAKWGYVNPKFFDFDQSIIILAMVVLGGMGSIPGVIAGAVILYAGPDLLRTYLPELQTYRLLGVGAIMILLMIYRPQGLFGSSRLRAELAGEEDGG
jgi:branched-chain amino acid transport system permease protein